MGSPAVGLLKGEAVCKYLSFRRVHPGRHPHRLRRPPTGGQRWVDPTGHVGPCTWAYPNWLTGAWAWAAPQALPFCCQSGQGILDAHQVLITQISGCEALVLQYGADCITSVGTELRQEPRR